MQKYNKLNNFIYPMMKKDQEFLNKIKLLVKKIIIEQTANGYHVQQIQPYIISSLQSHLMPSRSGALQRTQFLPFIKELVLQSKFTSTELFLMIIQFLQNQLKAVCIQNTDIKHDQNAPFNVKNAKMLKNIPKQKQIKKQLNPEQLQSFIKVKYEKKQKPYKNEENFEDDYFEEYQNDLNREMFEKILLKQQIISEREHQSQIKDKIKESFFSSLESLNGAVKDLEDTRSKIERKRLDYFNI